MTGEEIKRLDDKFQQILNKTSFQTSSYTNALILLRILELLEERENP